MAASLFARMKAQSPQTGTSPTPSPTTPTIQTAPVRATPVLLDTRIQTYDENWRVLVSGAAHSGKTTFANTFPDPLFLDFDKKAPVGAETLPFWDGEWVRKHFPWAGPVPNVRDAVLEFMRHHIQNYPGRTLVLDGWSSLVSRFFSMVQYTRERYLSKDNQHDQWKVFGHLLDYSAEILNLSQTHKGHFIVTCHEAYERDNKGVIMMNKLKPYMQGSFPDAMPGFFTCSFRMLYHKDKFPETAGHTIQVQPDLLFKPLTPQGFVADQPYIPATYQEILKRIKYATAVQPNPVA